MTDEVLGGAAKDARYKRDSVAFLVSVAGEYTCMIVKNRFDLRERKTCEMNIRGKAVADMSCYFSYAFKKASFYNRVG